MNTLLLDTVTWDLCKDVFGNIAMATEPYSIQQDVSSAVRLFKAELWYNTRDGIPYFKLILGKAPPRGLAKRQIESAAKSVPGVLGAKVLLQSFDGRRLRGQIEILDKYNQTLVVSF